MKVTAYIRIAKNGWKTKLDANTKANHEPLSKMARYNSKEFLPTVGFAVDFVIPDELFEKAMTTIAEVNVGLRDAKILADLPVPEKKKRA